MGYKTPKIMIFVLSSSSGSPNDSTTYYYGPTTKPITPAATYSRFYPLVAGSIVGCDVYATMDNAGTEETYNQWIRKNNTTDTLVELSNMVTASQQGRWKNFSLNIPLLTTDYIEMKFTTPAWVTNPTSYRQIAYVYYKIGEV